MLVHCYLKGNPVGDEFTEKKGIGLSFVWYVVFVVIMGHMFQKKPRLSSWYEYPRWKVQIGTIAPKILLQSILNIHFGVVPRVDRWAFIRAWTGAMCRNGLVSVAGRGIKSWCPIWVRPARHPNVVRGCRSWQRRILDIRVIQNIFYRGPLVRISLKHLKTGTVTLVIY